MKNSVGVIGGLGPLATGYFVNLVIENTKAEKDQDHINMIIFNHATTYDRTDFIIGKCDKNPTNTLVEDAQTLEKLGCNFLVMPCNTAHYFYDEIEKNISIEFINMVDCTIENIKSKSKVGIMATDGTLFAHTYQQKLKANGIKYFIPNKEKQKIIMSLIYDYVKKGKKVSKEIFDNITKYFFDNECDYIIIACTELSVICKDLNITDNRIIDSLKSLVYKTIQKSGKEIV